MHNPLTTLDSILKSERTLDLGKFDMIFDAEGWQLFSKSRDFTILGTLEQWKAVQRLLNEYIRDVEAEQEEQEPYCSHGAGCQCY